MIPIPTTDQPASHALAGQLRELLCRLRTSRVDEFLLAWPRDLCFSRPMAACPIPVLRYLDRLAADAPPFATPFATRLAAEAMQLLWCRSYGAPRMGAVFMENYGYCELMATHAARGRMGVSAGVLLLGPDTVYPAHWHEAEELYVPLVGAALWWQGVQGWQSHPPGTLIHHACHEPHAMRTGAEPLLALYLWRSNDLHQKSKLLTP